MSEIMIITNIMPCIKVTKENNLGGIEMYIELGDKVKVSDFDGNINKGIVLSMELGKDEEEDDNLYLLLDNGRELSIGFSYIEDIDVL